MAELLDESIRLQVLLERVKAGEDKWIDAFLQDEAKILRQKLTRADLSPGERKRIEALIEEVREALSVLHARHGEEFLARLDELGEVVADTEAKSLAAALDNFDTAVPTAQTIRAAVNTAPLSVRGAGGGMLLEAFVAKWGEANVERVVGTIRRGYFEGRTTDQVVRDLIGTKAANYTDGELAVSRRHARTVVHTSVQHLATVARMETFKENEDLITGYRWVSTLDSKTSQICQALDGRVFKIGEGPMPPAHPNCRSTIVPVLKSWQELGIDLPDLPIGERASMHGPVPANLTYFEWLKTQPASFVDEALGETRAAVFLKGGISADEFAKLQLGRNFQPLTIEEMREKAPKVFERAGV
ncbi:minor capsid protein [Lysobacter niastensis]|uniref:Minor capsid protein n=1 Tax=Lysobacter niastensis TaxID=380629 RepID=A0ABS0B307_9GAMM|nr:minor capsid protein [Lysobacter niastensis]MBF6022869.1 minor capsid protein [Lysobacter niastensis]